MSESVGFDAMDYRIMRRPKLFLARPELGGVRFGRMHGFELYGRTLALWLQAQNESRPIRFEKVAPGDEEILPPREQRELDALPSGLDPAGED